MSLGKLEAAVVFELRPPDLRSCAVGQEESCVIFFVLLPVPVFSRGAPSELLEVQAWGVAQHCGERGALDGTWMTGSSPENR